MKRHPKHGGRRLGAGRKPGSGRYGEPTVRLRVPKSRETYVRAWLNGLAVDSHLMWPVGHELFLSLPIIGRVAAYQVITSEVLIERYVKIDRYFFHPEPDYLLRIHDDSMCDAGILRRDLIAVNQSIDAKDNQVIVARVNGRVMVKRYKLARGRILLTSENPQFEPIKIHPQTADFRIEGVCVGVIRIRGFT